MGRAGRSCAQDPHRQQALLRRRRPAGCRGDRQHHFARPHAAFPVRRLLRGVQAGAFQSGRDPAAQVGARQGRAGGRRALPDDLRPARRRRGRPDGRHALLQAPDEAHGDQGHRQVLHHAARRSGQLPHGGRRGPLETQDGFRAVLRDGRSRRSGQFGEICTVMEASKHAIGVRTTNNSVFLIHVGIETVSMKGEGFEYLVKKGQHVKEGQPILKFDKAKIEAKGLNPVVVFVKTDEGNQTPVAFKTGINVKAGKDVIGE